MNAATPVTVLRQALVSAVEETSLRQVSRLVGMSPTGLQKFIDGAHPYSATRRKLERWYVLHGPGRMHTELRGDSALAILRVLVQDLAPPRHRPTMELLLVSLEDAYATAHIPRPDWLGELRERLQREPRA